MTRDAGVRRADADATRPDRFAIAALLHELSALTWLDDPRGFRARAYRRGAQALEGLGTDLGELLAHDRLTAVPGIGPGLARMIHEAARSGRIAMLDHLRRQYPPGVVALSRVLTPARARQVHDALGVATLEGLRAACVAGQVRGLRGFGARTEAQLIARIDRIAAHGDRMLLPEALRAAAQLVRWLQAVPMTRVAPAGQIRRRVEAIDRIELLATTADRRLLLARLRGFPTVLSVDPHGADRYLVRQASGPDIALRLAAPGHSAAAWLDTTGAAAHLAQLRRRATERGLMLTRDGLQRDGQSVPARREADIYAALGLPYMPPELREGSGEIDAAADGTLPADLVRRADLQGVVHCHTDYSDGAASIEAMARGAEALGLRYITITDHSASAGYAGGLTVERLRRQREEIARVQERVGIRILHGTESDILRNGELDFPDAVLAELEVVIASVHQRHKLDADAMTARLLRAMRHPRFKIWGHALGRYVLSRPPFACHVEQVLDAIAESRAAIEVNGDPHRLDMAPLWLRQARRRGIRFVISADAHSVGGLNSLRWGTYVARRGWLQRAEVLNTLDADAFAAAVRP
jgi:DNA polymerase (family 10)